MSSRESSEQGRTGRRGAEASRETGRGKQPPQRSERVEASPPDPEPKHHFEPGTAPSDQGEKEHPSPETIARHQQGVAGRGTGRRGSSGNRRGGG